VTEIATADEWRSWLREALTSAMRERRVSAIKALRSTLSAIDNAEAVDATEALTPDPGPIAGAVSGLGAGEVARRQLTSDDVRAIIQREIDERLAAALDYERAGREERAGELRAEAAVIEILTTTVG
jgi:uncharacterized protein YqeY